MAIARELRALHPGLEIDWLAQHPVTEVLAECGERIHPASEFLFSESAHFEDECGEHDLWCFEALRRMDEIMIANFMLFLDVVRAERYDLWIGDEAWDVDYFLHENPEQKRAPYCWITDFVGYLPMPDGHERERRLTADYNAEMIGHVESCAVRDRAIFVGNPADIVPASFGPGLPQIRKWTQAHYVFSGYITGFSCRPIDREQLRAQFGYQALEKICVVSVGGSGVGTHLLQRVIEAYPLAKATLPGLRMVVVCGPRISTSALPSVPGVEVHSYLPNLHEHFAACDIGVVQGGLTSTMELAACVRPFLYFPLRHHFEQEFHVRHRLERYRAGRRMEYHLSDAATIARAIVEELTRPVSSLPVEADGAAKAASLIASML